MRKVKKSEKKVVTDVVTSDMAVCVRCGKPATIFSPDNKPFCDLSCKSASEMK